MRYLLPFIFLGLAGCISLGDGQRSARLHDLRDACSALFNDRRANPVTLQVGGIPGPIEAAFQTRKVDCRRAEEMTDALVSDRRRLASSLITVWIALVQVIA